MPWFNELDPDVPQDIESAAEGAERFRELKRAIIERLSTVFRGFPNDHPDREGETILFPSAGAMVGTEAQRPNFPDREGHIWFSTNTGRIYVGNRNQQWQQIAEPELPDFPSGLGVFRGKVTKNDAQNLPDAAIYRIKFEVLRFKHGPNVFDWDGIEDSYIINADGPVSLQAQLRLVQTSGLGGPATVRLERWLGVPFVVETLAEQIVAVGDGSPANVVFAITDEAVEGIQYFITVERHSSTGNIAVQGVEARSFFSIHGFVEPEEADEDYDYDDYLE